MPGHRSAIAPSPASQKTAQKILTSTAWRSRRLPSPPTAAMPDSTVPLIRSQLLDARVRKNPKPAAGMVQTLAGTGTRVPSGARLSPVTATERRSARRGRSDEPPIPRGARTRRVTAPACGDLVTSAISCPVTAQPRCGAGWPLGA